MESLPESESSQQESQITKSVEEKDQKKQYVYLLVSTSGATYVGATIDLDHRLRQHNKEIKGGAQATSAKVVRGETWRRHCYVSGFPTWQSALQFEWRWKQIHRKLPRKCGSPLENRMKALDMLLALDRPTSKAMAYSEWESPPLVVLEPEPYQN
jgi:structure-specific endonuclease subunit SLX1